MNRRVSKRAGKYLSTRRQDLPSGRSVVGRRSISPAELFLSSFLALIVLGTVALKTLPSLYRTEPLNWTDAIFTATSAVCVTGLIVVDTATYFTFAGQLVLLILIQLGGLGMLVLTSVIITALGGRPSIHTESMAATSRSVIPHIPARTLIADIVLFTLAIEAAGAIVLYALWVPRLGWQGAIWPSIFHSISAFCNAGFSTHTDSLIGYQDSPVSLYVISLLVILGGLGFVVIEEVLRFAAKRRRLARRLSVHSKLVLVSTAVLVLVPWAMFLLFEWSGVLDGMPLSEKIANAWFMSVTPRTAGFNTIDYADASDSSNFLTIILMMIGGSPGSTAGGMKTTTFVLLAMQAWSRLRSNETVTFAGRSIPEETIQRASGLFVITTGSVVTGVLLLASVGDLAGHHPSFISRMFEVVSAFNTVGLSMGITPTLSSWSRWLMILLMFIGRTGPLAVAAALIIRLSRRGKYRLAYEDVIVG